MILNITFCFLIQQLLFLLLVPTQKHLDGTEIAGARINQNLAKDIMIHIGGTYSILSFDHLGGSFGCFGFIPKGNVHKTQYSAERASVSDSYDDNLSNEPWKKVCQDIVNLAFGSSKREIQILLRPRLSNTQYIPTKILEE